MSTQEERAIERKANLARVTRVMPPPGSLRARLLALADSYEETFGPDDAAPEAPLLREARPRSGTRPPPDARASPPARGRARESAALWHEGLARVREARAARNAGKPTAGHQADAAAKHRRYAAQIRALPLPEPEPGCAPARGT